MGRRLRRLAVAARRPRNRRPPNLAPLVDHLPGRCARGGVRGRWGGERRGRGGGGGGGRRGGGGGGGWTWWVGGPAAPWCRGGVDGAESGPCRGATGRAAAP